MQAIKDIYRIGHGPSSSHTIAPKRAIDYFLKEYGLLDYYHIDLFGSLALTGKGHHTDDIIRNSLAGAEVDFDFHYDTFDNKLVIKGYKENELIDEWVVMSLGGGSIRIDKFPTDDEVDIYPLDSFKAIKEEIQKRNITLLAYIYDIEKDLKEYLSTSFDAMLHSVEEGLSSKGLLNKELSCYRVAGKLFGNAEDEDSRLIAYAYAAGEENASGHIVCTAPTLGSCGIVASLMYHLHIDKKVEKELLLDALAIGGLFGNLIKKNASISGAIGGCQAEVGTACAMAAAMIAYLEGASIELIEYSAEVGIEHHLGLTCDPVMGFVIVPCIERNAAAILRAFDSYRIAKNLLMVKKNLIDFDTVVESMNDTGEKIPSELKETSLGGLAVRYRNGQD